MGNMRALATVFYNDPSVQLGADYQQFLATHSDGVAQALTQMTDGPKGASTGFLSFWTAFEITANQDPNVQAFPDHQPFYIQAATVSGAHANVEFKFDPKATLIYHLTLSQVGGDWYISNQWTTGNP